MFGIPIILKRWNPLFYASQEKMVFEPIWVQLPNILLQFWTYEQFRPIGNYLGEFIDANMSFKEIGAMKVSCILVNLDVR